MNRQRKKRSHAAYWIIIIVLAVVLFGSMLLNMGLMMGLAARGGSVQGGEKGIDEFPRLVERWSYGEGEVKAVRIPVYGVIARERHGGVFASPYDKVEVILRQIRAAQNDKKVKAIVLEVDSPGGGMTASDEVYHALLEFKESSDDRKIIVFTKDLAASGGYLVSMAGDWVVAEPTCLVGSVGVILQTLNWKEMSEKIGIKDTTIKSGENKDMLNPFRDVTPEERAQMQELMDTFHEHFSDIVRKGRDMDAETLAPLADGRVFTAKEALEKGLVDEIGYWEEVVARTKALLGQERVKFTRYDREANIFGFFSSVRSPVSFSSLAELQTPRVMFLWRP